MKKKTQKEKEENTWRMRKNRESRSARKKKENTGKEGRWVGSNEREKRGEREQGRRADGREIPSFFLVA